MTVFATYCSSEKEASAELLPAIQRYKSRRILSVYKAATQLGLGFVVLSGKYGLLRPNDEVVYYDHLLLREEVASHKLKVASQLASQGIDDIVFYSVSPEEDPLVVPYMDCMRQAAEQVGAAFKLVIFDLQD